MDDIEIKENKILHAKKDIRIEHLEALLQERDFELIACREEIDKSRLFLEGVINSMNVVDFEIVEG
jgi:hypothetical protein